MKVINAPFLHCDTVEEYREVFIRELVNKRLKFQGYKLTIKAEDFEHACFERGKGNVEKSLFSQRRSRRILFIPALCKEQLPYKIIYQKERNTPSICVLMESLETAVYFYPQKGRSQNRLVLMTLIAYGDSVTSRMEKQLSAGEIIESISEVF